MNFEDAMKELREIEGVRVTIPCPEGIKGCLVYHYKVDPGPIELVIRAEIERLEKRT